MIRDQPIAFDKFDLSCCLLQEDVILELALIIFTVAIVDGIVSYLLYLLWFFLRTCIPDLSLPCTLARQAESSTVDSKGE